MDDQLRRTLNDKIDRLRAADVLPDFEQAQLWTSIQGRLETEKPARRAISLRSFAAAAALAGLLVGGLAMRFFSSNHPESRMTAVEHRFDTAAPNTIAAVPAQPKGIPSLQVPAKAPSRRSRTVGAHAARIAVVQQTPALRPAAPPPELAAPAPQILRKPRAVHILDLDARSRTAVLNENPATPDKPGLLEVITVRTMPEPGVQTAPSSILRHP